MGEILTVEQVATRLRCSRWTIYRRVKAGAWPTLAAGGKLLRFDWGELQRAIARKERRVIRTGL